MTRSEFFIATDGKGGGPMYRGVEPLYKEGGGYSDQSLETL